VSPYQPVCLNHRQEHAKGSPAELYRPAVGKSFAAMRQDPETAELDAGQRFGHEHRAANDGRHHLRSPNNP
jgi:hypothetical protein